MVIAEFVEGDGTGGTERLVVQIAQNLRERGHTVVGIGPADGPGKGWLGSELRRYGVIWETIPKRHMLDPRSVSDVVTLIRRHKIEAVHSHEFSPSVYGALASRMTGRPHLITMHSNLYFAGARRRRAALRLAVRLSRAVVAVSRDTKDDAMRILGLDPGAIEVIPNGIAARPGNRASVRRELALDDSQLLILAIGNLSPRKSHIDMLRALLALQARRPEIPWHLAIAGSDLGSRAELEATIIASGVAARVHLLGRRTDTEDLLAACDIFAMTSLHEGMPLAIMEAMFAARPVLSTAAGGIGEMITSEVDGLLTPVGDVGAISLAFERLLSDAPLRSRLANAARLRGEREFAVAPMVDRYLALLDAPPKR